LADENRGVWVFSEVPSLAFELLAKGKTLANDLQTELAAISVGRSDPEKFFHYGADRVLQIKNQLLYVFQVETYTDAFASLATERKPDIILIGATRNGLEFAPRLAERLKSGCVTEVGRLELDAERKALLMDRITFGGNVVETHVCRAKPQIATVPKGLFSPLPADESRTGDLETVDVDVKPPNTRLLESRTKQSKGVRVGEAAVVVSLGRGVRRKEDISLIEKFAEAVGGALGCSRPIAEDLHWLPVDQYIGLSGQKVSPKLYIACGISGQVQHLTGIRNSRIIVAINSDSKAPIFEYSDYGIVGDLYEFVPALTDALKKASNT